MSTSSDTTRHLAWHGPMRPPVRGADGRLSHSLYVWAYDDGTVQVSSDRLSECCAPTEDELADALAAAVRGMAEAIAAEREACAKIAADIVAGNTEIPRKDAAAWIACADFICDEIRGRE